MGRDPYPASSTWDQSLFNPNGRQQNRNSHVRSGIRDRSVDPSFLVAMGSSAPVNTRTLETSEERGLLGCFSLTSKRIE